MRDAMPKLKRYVLRCIGRPPDGAVAERRVVLFAIDRLPWMKAETSGYARKKWAASTDAAQVGIRG